MKRQIAFDQDGIGTAVVYKEELEDGLFELPDSFASDFGPRYRLIDDAIVDSYAGKTDEDVHTTLAQEEADRAAALAATKPAASLILSKEQFMDLFEDTELEALYTAAKSDVPAEIFLDRLKASTTFDLKSNVTITGIGKLRATGILTAERAAAILDNVRPANVAD